MEILISSILGYGFGCIQSSFIISKLILREDIRKKGNGNAGASNMTVAYGKKFGAAVAIIDILKAIFAIIAIKYIFSGSSALGIYMYVAGLFVILGHNYPFYMNFKGGKGTASLIGMLFGISPLLGTIGFVTFTLFALLSDYIVIGTFALLISFFIMTVLFFYGGAEIAICILICALSLYNHRKNIRDIMYGNERKIRKSLSK